jgi:transcription elongation factor Elf1
MIPDLTEPVDVYSHWIDECEKKHKEDFFLEDSKE